VTTVEVMCGALARQGGKKPTAILLAGCGKLTEYPIHLVRWQPGEDAVGYHVTCCPLPHPHPTRDEVQAHPEKYTRPTERKVFVR
jgi:hypothetical protein